MFNLPTLRSCPSYVRGRAGQILRSASLGVYVISSVVFLEEGGGKCKENCSSLTCYELR